MTIDSFLGKAVVLKFSKKKFYISDGGSNYLHNDGAIRGSTSHHGLYSAYWTTKYDAEEYLKKMRRKQAVKRAMEFIDKIEKDGLSVRDLLENAYSPWLDSGPAVHLRCKSKHDMYDEHYGETLSGEAFMCKCTTTLNDTEEEGMDTDILKSMVAKRGHGVCGHEFFLYSNKYMCYINQDRTKIISLAEVENGALISYWGTKEKAEEFLRLTKTQQEKKMDDKKYKTKPIDYTGCDEVIKKHLENNEAVLCDLSRDGLIVDGTCRKYVRGWDEDTREYIVSGTNIRTRYKLATPIAQTQYVKKASEIVKWLEGVGYLAGADGIWRSEDGECFPSGYFSYCGKPAEEGSRWHEEWLEYK